jgi:hypothetical protein
MKYKLLRYALLSTLFAFCGTAIGAILAEGSDFQDVKADFTNGSFFTAEETNVISAGLKMNADGTFTRVAADAADANAVITGKFHSNEHGISNFSATVKVNGPVESLVDFAEKNGVTYAQLKAANLWLRDSKLENKAGKEYSIIIPGRR